MENLISYLQTFLLICNCIGMIYIFVKFVNKPQDDLKTEVAELKLEIKEIKQSLLQGNDRFRTQSYVLEVLIRCTLALIGFEIHYCESEHKEISQELRDAQKALHECLSKRNDG